MLFFRFWSPLKGPLLKDLLQRTSSKRTSVHRSPDYFSRGRTRTEEKEKENWESGSVWECAFDVLIMGLSRENSPKTF